MRTATFSVLLIIAVVIASSAYADDLQRRTDKWFEENPHSLPIWLTPDELLRLDEIGSRITPTDPPPGPVRNVAEFEPMAGVLIRYPLGIPLNLVAAMSQHTTVYTIVGSSYQQNQATSSYTSNGANMANCEFIIAPTNSYWTRDYGPWFVFNGDDDLGVVNFSYNRPRPQDDNIPAVFANEYDLPLYGMNINHTGGNYMSNSVGTAASTNIVYTENSSMTPNTVDQYVEDFLGITDHIVVQDPTGTYIDHIDCWAKFLAPDKILIRSVPESHSQYNQIETIVDYFAGLTSPYNTPYKIYRVYTPNNQPYTNSLILNDRVYVPTVNSTWDAAAIQTYEDAMPGYEIVGVYSNGWQSTDALHCRTKEIADGEMLYVNHLPLLNEQPYIVEYELSAYIFPYSGEPLVTDSLVVMYQINDQPYQQIQLTESAEDNYYSATLSALAPADTISYYIYASDMSGREVKHPIMGELDPHVFYIAGDGTVPEITHYPVEEVYYDELPIHLNAAVTHPEGISHVDLEYLTNGSTDLSILEFVPVTDVIWQCNWGNEAEPYDQISYRIKAYDTSDPPYSAVYPEAGWFVFQVEMRQTSDPEIYPEGGEYSSPVNVEIESEHDDAIIYYTLDGSEPSEESSIYIEPIPIETSAVVKAMALADRYLPSEVISVEYVIKDVGITGDEVSGAETKLVSAYPNPFNPGTNISFELARPAHVEISIYNIKGHVLKNLIDDFYPHGNHVHYWDGTDNSGKEVAAGVYFYKMKTGNYSAIKKMIMLK
jgi:agmatine deiminase